ncbi:MAG: YqgE/AlgH family protein [Alphaproteobacteria bacterium]|nr:YqgE/AlgH family protein [Alphaproteobacteria bacterium]
MSMQRRDAYLEGQMLIAMPAMSDPRFQRTVIYMCAHNAEGAMGLVVNKAIDSITFPDLLRQLHIEPATPFEGILVHSGGPVETGRGFVLHSDDYRQDATLVINGGFALTATIDVLRAIAAGGGPKQRLMALGYAGWSAGQLDAEIQNNGWLVCSPDEDLVFSRDLQGKWDRAVHKIGVDPAKLSTFSGHA